MDALPYGIVAFLDFLGFREMIERDAGPAPPVHLPLILEALDQVEQRVNESGLAITQFSDSVVLSAQFKVSEFQRLVVAVRDLQRLLIERRIAIRGGIALGQHYAEQGRLFSHALLKAYLLETGRANVPRVLVDHNLLDWITNHDDFTTDLADEINPLLTTDRDGESFVHYLAEDLLDPHASLIQSILTRGQERGSSSLIGKAHWMVDYHEWVTAQLGCEGLREEVSARFTTFAGL